MSPGSTDEANCQPPSCRVGVAAILECADLAKQLDRIVLTSRHVLHQAEDEAALFRKLRHDRRNRRLPERDEGLDPPLAVDQVVGGFAVGAVHPTHLDRLLEPDVGDAVDDLEKLPLVPEARVEDCDPIVSEHYWGRRPSSPYVSYNDCHRYTDERAARTRWATSATSPCVSHKCSTANARRA